MGFVVVLVHGSLLVAQLAVAPLARRDGWHLGRLGCCASLVYVKSSEAMLTVVDPRHDIRPKNAC